jgi:hypothetical protein
MDRSKARFVFSYPVSSTQKLGRHEDFFAWDAARANCLPDGFLVLIGGRGVEESVSDAERVLNASLALGEVGVGHAGENCSRPSRFAAPSCGLCARSVDLTLPCR